MENFFPLPSLKFELRVHRALCLEYVGTHLVQFKSLRILFYFQQNLFHQNLICSSVDPHKQWMLLQQAHFRRSLVEFDPHDYWLNKIFCHNAYLLHMAHYIRFRKFFGILEFYRLRLHTVPAFHWHDVHKGQSHMVDILDENYMGHLRLYLYGPNNSMQPLGTRCRLRRKKIKIRYFFCLYVCHWRGVQQSNWWE